MSGCLYGTVLLSAEYEISEAVLDRDVARLERAAHIAPFRYWIRMAQGRYAIGWRAEPSVALPAIDAALAGAPYSADLWFARMTNSLALGRITDAEQSFDRVRALVPRSPMVLQICGDRKECPVTFRMAE